MDEYRQMHILAGYEGNKLNAYPDPIYGWQVPTIGIGHAIIHPDKALMKLVGDRYDDVRNGKSSLTDREVERLFFDDLEQSALRAKVSCGMNRVEFDKLPDELQELLVRMAFQLGSKLTKFHKMFDAISAHNWAGMIEEMKDSNWYHQTPNRVNAEITLIRVQLHI